MKFIRGAEWKSDVENDDHALAKFKTMNLNELAKQVHAANIKWWQSPETSLPIERNKGELLMLAVTELAEAVEGIRKNLMDDKLPHRKMEEVEMADAKIRLLDLAVGFNVGELVVFNEYYFYDATNKSEQILKICESVLHIYETSSYMDDLHWEVSVAIGGIESYCREHGLDLEGAIREKMEFNRTRADHTHEARQLAGGKKF